jgi:tetratricopeptide (TPR) repeat protein
LAGRRDEALETLEFAVRMNPSVVDSYAMRGYILAVGGRPEEAIADLEKAMRLSPRGPDTSLSCYMGVAHFAAGRYDAAVEWLQRSQRQEPSFFGPSRVLASSYAQLGRLEEAREALDEARRLEPGLSIARIKLDFAGADPSVVERYFEGLRKAGLKEE